MLPDPRIKLDGFPTCGFVQSDDWRCMTEVAVMLARCAKHGGPPLSTEALQRTLFRQMRGVVETFLSCCRCADIPLTDLRCPRCSASRGAAYALGGISERMGWEADSFPLLVLICPRRDEEGKR